LPYIADIDVNFGGVATSIEDFGTIGVAAKVVSLGDIEETTESQPEGTGTLFNPTLSVIGLTYARQLTAAVQFGATANFISENIDEASAQGMSFDFGVIYNPNWQGVSIGIAIKNYGPDMKFDGSGFETADEDLGARRVTFQTSPFELPGFIALGLSWNLLNQDLHSATFSGNFRSNNHSQDFWQGGAEYNYNDMFFLRAGYNYADQDEFLYGASFGAGVSFDLSEAAKLTFEYAWTETELFEDNQYFTFRANF
jgi:opacity protein-like surface antigen